MKTLDSAWRQSFGFAAGLLPGVERHASGIFGGAAGLSLGVPLP
jgi:hypothetical protein